MQISAGPWPVTLTPFTEAGAPDFDAIDRYVDWLIEHRAAGLFAVALSGEMYELTLDERIAVAARTVARAAGRVPVIAAAVGDGTAAGLAAEVGALAATGADAVVLIASTVLADGEDEGVLFDTVDAVIAAHPEVPLGIYECPLPYHRILTTAAIERLAATGRFVFFKETSHDVELMRERVRVGGPHGLRIFNAGIENYVESLEAGVSGLSGWVVNVAPDRVAHLGDLVAAGRIDDALALQAELARTEQAMGPTYPSSAKAIVNERGDVAWGLASRWRPAEVDMALVAELAAKLEVAP